MGAGRIPPPTINVPKNATINSSKDVKDQGMPKLSNLVTIGASSKRRGIIGFGLGFLLMDPDDGG